jgi:hypothetical protein
MSFFSIGESDVKYAVLVDIGSGSVLASIVASDPNKSHPDIIWSKREYTPFRETDEITNGAKSVMTSLMNVFMALDSEGRSVFREKTGVRKIPYLIITISAPWSYTVTKTISYKQKEEFTVSSTLISELLRASQKKVIEELKENEKMHDLGLSIISRTTTDVISNGYRIKITEKQKAKSLKVVQSSVIIQKYLTDAVLDVRDKVFPNIDLMQYSFMLVYFYAMKDLYPTDNEFCLIDITYEATEIGVVRDGVLQYCTHIPYGSFSIAREISTALSVPLEEALMYLKEADITTYLAQYSEKQQKEVLVILNKYKEQLQQLFLETGDSLSIPKMIFLHSDLSSEPFFKKQITEACKSVTSSSHVVNNVTTDLLMRNYSEKDKEGKENNNNFDTALLISAQFFHTQDFQLDFEQL